MTRLYLIFAIIFTAMVAYALPAAEAIYRPGNDPAGVRAELHLDVTRFQPGGEPAMPDFVPVTGVLMSGTQLEDLLISENSGPANFRQDNGDIAGLSGGRMAVVWEDNRFGPVGIMLQLFDSFGNPIGSNSPLVIGDDFDLQNPVISADTTNHFYIVWRESANGHLQAARFDSTGSPVGEIFYVSDTALLGFAGEFDAACMSDGQLAVTWESYTIGNDIVFRLYDTDGSPLTAITTVNTDSPQNKHWSPVITIGDDDDIAIAWEDYRGSQPDVYFRFFSSSGTPYFDEYPLSDEEARNFGRFMPDLVYSEQDGYTAGWTDLREGTNIYLQRVTPAGSLQGNNILMTGGTSQDENWELDLAVNSLGRLVAVWTLYDLHNAIMLQKFFANVQMQGSAQEISGDTDSRRFSPAVTSASNDNLGLVWTDLITGSIDIGGAVLDAGGSTIRPPFTVNDDEVGSPSFEPDVAGFSQYEWIVVFTDQRRDAGDIMMQRVYVAGELLGPNRRINTDAVGGIQAEPTVAAAADIICVSWTDNRGGEEGNQNIVCRFTHTSGDLTDEIVVNDDGGTASHYGPDVAINNDSLTLVVWTDTRSDSARVYGQLFGAGYEKTGDNILIGPSETGSTGEEPVILVDSDMSFFVAYLNRIDQKVEIKRVSVGGLVSGAFDFKSDRAGFIIDDFDIARASDDRLYLVWRGFNAGQTDLFLTVLNSEGLVVEPTRAITDDFEAHPEWPSISANHEGYLLITWLDHRTGYTAPFRQILDPTYLPIQGNMPVYGEAGSYMQAPVVAAEFGRGVFAWADARENGLNVYASLVLFSPTDVDEDNEIIPATYRLAQNHPNPFNPVTTIDFALPRAARVRIEAFNLLGQRIRTLTDDIYPAGVHTVTWDGKNDAGETVASGIYFYRMQSEAFLQTRKMLFMK